LTYANAVLPHALFVAAQRWPNEPFLEIAETSLSFLDRESTRDDFYWPIGTDGWRLYGEAKADYDQQPVEAVTMAEAALAGYEVLHDQKCLAAFGRARDWFHGKNSLGQSLVEVGAGACCDGLQSGGVNRNQGAESTLAYLWTELHHLELQQSLGERTDGNAASA
jgi:hypothetical protein